MGALPIIETRDLRRHYGDLVAMTLSCLLQYFRSRRLEQLMERI